MEQTRLILGLSLLLLLSAGVQAENGKPLTLHECINEAMGRSPRLEADRYTLQADNEAIKKARAGLLPDLTGAAELQNLTGSPISPFAVLNVNDVGETGVTRSANGRSPTRTRVSLATVGNGSLQMRYPLYQDGSILGLNNAPAVAAAKGVYTRQGWTNRLSEQTVIETVAGVFYNATTYLQKSDFDRDKVKLSKKRLEIVKQELALDLTLPQYLELAKAQLYADEQVLTTSQQRAADSIMQLNQIIGRPLQAQSKLDLSEPQIPALPPLGNFLNRVASLHPAVGVQQADIDIAKQNLRLAQAALLPSVNFVTSYTGATAFGSQNPDLLFAMLRVEVPIFDFGHNLAAEREQRDRLKAAEAELGQVNLDVRESILNQLSDIHATESTIAGLERDYIQAKNNVALIQEQHDQGISTQLTLVDAQETLVKIESDLLLAKLVQRLQYVQLQKLSGGVWVWNR
jgi:outer membrane protein TolC